MKHALRTATAIAGMALAIVAGDEAKAIPVLKTCVYTFCDAATLGGTTCNGLSGAGKLNNGDCEVQQTLPTEENPVITPGQTADSCHDLWQACQNTLVTH